MYRTGIKRFSTLIKSRDYLIYKEFKEGNAEFKKGINKIISMHDKMIFGTITTMAVGMTFMFQFTNEKFKQVDQKFDHIDQKFEQIDQKFELLLQEIRNIKK